MKRQPGFSARRRQFQPIVQHEYKRISTLVLAACIALLTFGLACQTPAPADTRAADENALREVDAQWSKAAGTKDIDKTVSYYASDAIVLPPNGPIPTTKEAIRAVWKDMIASPGAAISWKASRVEVARSGELGYLSGTYEFSMNDASGKPIKDHGKFVEVWKKQADGSWKCVTDIWNSDLPAPAPPEKK
jgi:ketosteroid isomerase-like protein